ncbi:MAG: hypothetical protein MUF24_01055 [Chitinophagaceae bacterium]|jgi:hypothetical protein|nr:hypothetical protein [Chitinophagaceae bacterium]
MRSLYIFTTVVFIALSIAACQKVMPVPRFTQLTNTKTLTLEQQRLSYGNNLFWVNHPQPEVSPISRPKGSGYFKAIPQGLAIDSLSGTISIPQSLTGIRFKVFLLNPLGTPLDSTFVVIGGIDYADSIYEVDATPLVYDTAFPIYNANPALALPCSDSDDDNQLACRFDETDIDGDGDNDIDGVNQEKLLVDEKRGFIDVEASYRSGIFGSNPVNGTTRDFKMYYRITDGSNRAINAIDLRVYYYKKRSDIPQYLLDELQNRKRIGNRVSLEPSLQNNNRRINASVLTVDFEVYAKPKRPPLIIIVGQ